MSIITIKLNENESMEGQGQREKRDDAKEKGEIWGRTSAFCAGADHEEGVGWEW